MSLMGENGPITEAKRCVAKNGLLIITETTNSLSARLSELRNVIRDESFEINSDEESGDFTFIEARICSTKYVALALLMPAKSHVLS
ncbi:MAG: hypothetical protein WA667_21835 [Candidatus Nitrosopolaris sp.]